MTLPFQRSRYTAISGPFLAEGWRIERATPPSRLFGANGIRTGGDGRIYVAQVSGSQVSAIDIDSGLIETISPMGSAIVGPDDLVFDDAGNLYLTEVTEGRVSMLSPNGETRVIQGDMPIANPITFHAGRLIAGECRPGGRIMELDRDGGAPRVIATDVPMPNAFEVGPDGKLYFPVMGANEIWRVDLKGGVPEKVAGDLGLPDSVKFDAAGFIVSTQVASGQVLRIDPRTGDRVVLADIAPGLDNLTFVGDRLFVSSISGQVNEVLSGGRIRPLIEDGLQWPLGLATGPDGVLFVADGGFVYTLQPGGSLRSAGMLFSPGFPGYTRGVAAASQGEFVVTTSNGDVARFWPAEGRNEVLASGYDQLYGVAIAQDGAIVFAEQGTGRLLSVSGGRVEVLATGLDRPSGVAIGANGDIYVAESGSGKVSRYSGGRTETLVDNLERPQGLLVRDDRLYIVDAETKALIEYHLETGVSRLIAARLPVGPPVGVIPKVLGPIGNLAGPMGPFAGIAAGPDGVIYVSADAEGSVLAIRPDAE